jgi:hypothetical protein
MILNDFGPNNLMVAREPAKDKYRGAITALWERCQENA